MNISTPDKYYFITPEAAKEGFFSIIHPKGVVVNRKEICEVTYGKDLTVFPRVMIETINPAKDFTIQVKFNEYVSPVVYLGKVLTNDTFNSPELLTHAIIACSRHCIDLGEKLLILPKGDIVPKFTDLDVMKKLNDALNDAVYKVHRGYGFGFDLKGSDSGIIVEVYIRFSSDAHDRFTGDNVGNLKLLALREVPKTINDSEILTKSIIFDKAPIVYGEYI